MGKANKVKIELMDSVVMVDLIQTLKDVADSKFYTLLNQKYKFRRFGQSFLEFFRMMNLANVDHPLLKNDNSAAAILPITIDGGFLGPFNNKILRVAIEEEKEKYEKVHFLGVGEKSMDRLKPFDSEMKLFDSVEIENLYTLAVQIKDYVVEQVIENKVGKVIVIYSWPKSFEVQQTRVIQLLPCVDLVSKQTQLVSEFENTIQESSPESITESLVNLWITTRLYEILMDTLIGSAAAQANFLDEAVDKMKKEKEKTKVRYRKAKKSDIDKSLRETFSARMMASK